MIFLRRPKICLQVLLSVLSATGLAKTRWFGKAAPYAVVLVNRHEIGRTRTIFKTQNPIWDEPRETFAVRVTGKGGEDCHVAVQLFDEELGKSDQDTYKSRERERDIQT